MIITLMGIILLVVGIILVNMTDNESIFALAGLSLVIGVLTTLICVTLIFSTHLNVDYRIKSNQMEYEGLCKRLEVIQSEYEDVSKSDVIKDITEWNKSVYSAKHWSSSPWTNWMNNKKIADSLQYIEY